MYLLSRPLRYVVVWIWLLQEQVKGDSSLQNLLSQAKQAGVPEADLQTAARRLESEDGETLTRGTLGTRCGGNRPSCQTPFECTNLGMPLGNRCTPNACLKQEIELLQHGNANQLEEWQQSIFANAGIVEADYLEAVQLEQAQSSLPFLDTLRRSSIYRSNKNLTFQAVENHPEFIDTMQAILQKCSTTVNSRATDVALFYYGAHYEGGLFGDLSYSDIGGNLGMNCCPFGRFCIGAAYFGAQFGVNLGVFLCGEKDTSQIPGVYFMVELDLGFTFHGSFSYGLGTNGYMFLEFGLGAGWGVGAGGSACYTFSGGL